MEDFRKVSTRIPSWTRVPLADVELHMLCTLQTIFASDSTPLSHTFTPGGVVVVRVYEAPDVVDLEHDAGGLFCDLFARGLDCERVRFGGIFVHGEAFLLVDWLVECHFDTRLGVEDHFVDIESELEWKSVQRRIIHNDGVAWVEDTASGPQLLVRRGSKAHWT